MQLETMDFLFRDLGNVKIVFVSFIVNNLL